MLSVYLLSQAGALESFQTPCRLAGCPPGRLAPASIKVEESASAITILSLDDARLPRATLAARRASKRMAESLTWPVMDKSPEGRATTCEPWCALFNDASKKRLPGRLADRWT